MSWSNNAILEFVDLYRREQILWDPKHPLHRNRNEVTSAWHRIQSTLSMKCSVNDLKRKKESLMTSFRMHLHKKKKCPDGYRTSWFAYSLMESFLGGKYECDSSTNKTDTELLGNTSSYTGQVSPEHKITKQNVKPIERSNTSTPVRHRPSGSQSTGNHDYNYAKKEVEDDSHYFSTTDDKSEMDEYDLYGQLLAKKLRKLDEHQRDFAMHEIDNIMFRVKVQGNTPPSRTFTPSPLSGHRRVKSPVFIVTQSNQVQYEDENVPYETHMQGQPPS